MVDNALQRLHAWWTRRIVLPRWVAVVKAIYSAAVLVGAAFVLVLWWQAATRDEEADRNARIQSCASVYAATYSAWDAEANRLFGELVSASASDSDDVDPTLLTDYATSTSNTAELAKLRIGLGVFSADSVTRGNDFACPALPRRLMVTPTYPEGFTP